MVNVRVAATVSAVVVGISGPTTTQLVYAAAARIVPATATVQRRRDLGRDYPVVVTRPHRLRR